MNTSFERTTASDEWWTPKWIVDALGHFDLDPCEPVAPRYKLADMGYTKEDDGLSRPWFGRVWCNPPYSQPLLDQFCRKMAEHRDGIILVFARMGNKTIQNILLPNADAILFLRHRIRFVSPNGEKGSAGCDSCLIAFGENNVRALAHSGLDGFLMVRYGEWGNVFSKQVMTF